MTARKRAGKPKHQEIATRAYTLFLQSGEQHGHDLHHWLTAEQELIDDLVSARG